MNWLVFSISLVLFAAITHADSYGIRCGPNQVYSECANQCPQTCNNRYDPPRACIALCRPGCDCVEGYILHDGVCIPIAKCPRPLCSANRTFVADDINVRTCDNINIHPRRPGCYCAEGYVLNRRTGECILPQDCPRELKCYVNEKEDYCINPCPATCLDPNPPMCYPIRCEAGCVCTPPFIRDTESGYCIHPKECPVPICEGENEVYNFCGSRCTPVCNIPQPRICTEECVPGCYCEEGFIRAYDGGPCIPKIFC